MALLYYSGRKTGVATQLQKENPFCVAIHCMAHRLNLASSQAADAVPYLVRYQETLTDLYKYFHKSTARIEALSAIQRVLEMEEVKIKEVQEVRWIAFKSSLVAIYKTYPP